MREITVMFGVQVVLRLRLPWESLSSCCRDREIIELSIISHPSGAHR